MYFQGNDILTDFGKDEQNDKTTEYPILSAHCLYISKRLIPWKRKQLTTPYSVRVKAENFNYAWKIYRAINITYICTMPPFKPCTDVNSSVNGRNKKNLTTNTASIYEH